MWLRANASPFTTDRLFAGRGPTLLEIGFQATGTGSVHSTDLPAAYFAAHLTSSAAATTAPASLDAPCSARGSQPSPVRDRTDSGGTSRVRQADMYPPFPAMGRRTSSSRQDQSLSEQLEKGDRRPMGSQQNKSPFTREEIHQVRVLDRSLNENKSN